MDLDEAAGRLYALAPEEFVAARTELARQARRSGDRALARAIAALRRPTVAAWAVNRLARDHPLRLGELLDFGERLRRAWADQDAAALTELTARRAAVTGRLTRLLKSTAEQHGRPLSGAALTEAEQTLDAALVDADAAEQVRQGRLAHALSYSGFTPAPVARRGASKTGGTADTAIGTAGEEAPPQDACEGGEAAERTGRRRRTPGDEAPAEGAADVAEPGKAGKTRKTPARAGRKENDARGTSSRGAEPDAARKAGLAGRAEGGEEAASTGGADAVRPGEKRRADARAAKKAGGRRGSAAVPEGGASEPGEGERRAAGRDRRRRVAEDAERAAAEAGRDHAEWQAELARAEEEQRRRAELVGELEARLSAARRELADAERRLAVVRRDEAKARRQAATLRRRADEARRSVEE